MLSWQFFLLKNMRINMLFIFPNPRKINQKLVKVLNKIYKIKSFPYFLSDSCKWLRLSMRLLGKWLRFKSLLNNLLEMFVVSLVVTITLFKAPQNWKTGGARFKPWSRLSTKPFGVFRGFLRNSRKYGLGSLRKISTEGIQLIVTMKHHKLAFSKMIE